ncbi:MAG TPA: NADH-quinone oxidoreductase subunit C [Caulobacteraceae bacterium]|jgi:NADH-quinone oxidoreductase subunit C|nr:NADH-quinone oxidoreductase subunit C [Caulobacteraceae bacterium]
MTWRAADEDLAQIGQRIVADSNGAASGFDIAYGQLMILGPAHRVTDLLGLLRDTPGLEFQQLMDLAGADYPQRALRFDVVYNLLSLTRNQRVRVKVQTDEDTAVPSATGVYANADWFEREAFDMYGVFFSGHPDLRRILTDYGFHGNPLRKDFPMIGYVELRYDDDLKRVVYEPVKAMQFRSWDFLSPWEGASYEKPGQGYAYVLPGDEKAAKRSEPRG